jgi:hypothetical protein
MVPIMSLWMPIVLAAVLVFIASSIIHMVLGYHQSDFGKVAKEDDVMDAMRAAGMKPGDYLIPCGEGTQSMKDPVFLEKWAKGPSAFVTVMPSGPPTMGMQLVQWFVYCLLVSTVTEIDGWERRGDQAMRWSGGVVHQVA